MRPVKYFAVSVLFFCAVEYPLAAEELVVVVKPALVFRESPDTKAKIVGKIPYQAKVVVTGKSATAVTLMGIVGNWTQVTFEGKQGWVFGAFLARADSNKYYEIIGGVAQERSSDKCITLKASDFPKSFTGGCVGQTCDQGCGHFILRENGEVSTQDGCDGAGGSGKWKRSGNQVIIEYSVYSLPPDELCAYRDGSRECVRDEEQKSFKECGKKSGCVRKRRKVLAMPADNQFAIDGQGVCIYP